MESRVAVSVAAVAVVMATSHPALGAGRAPQHPATAARSQQLALAEGDVPKTTVRVTPLVRLTRGDARGVVTVERHTDNRMLRVIIESENYYSRSDVQLDGEDASRIHAFYWQDLPPGSYRVTVYVYGTSGLRGSTSVGRTDLLSTDR